MFLVISDPLEDIMEFISVYEEKYGRDHPVFYQGTYSQVLNDAKQELRFLLVYLHNEDNVDTGRFCRFVDYFRLYTERHIIKDHCYDFENYKRF